MKIFLKIGGNHFKRYITCANYEFYFRKMLSVFKFFVNKVIRKLLCIRYILHREFQLVVQISDMSVQHRVNRCTILAVRPQDIHLAHFDR